MMRRPSRRRFIVGIGSCPLLCSALFAFSSIAQEQPSSKLATWGTMAVAFFVEMKDSFNTMVILPAARENLARNLRAFSLQLFDLQQRKADFTRGVLSIQAAENEAVRQNRVNQARNDIVRQVDTVNNMRGNLRQILIALPPAYRAKGNELVDSLQLGLDDKVATLNDISQQLIGGPFDREKLMQEGEHAVDIVKKLRHATDEFLGVVENKPPS